MDDARKPNNDAAHGANTLDVMLGLADRELRFLRHRFEASGEIAQSTTGAEFIDALSIAALALTRLRLEREAGRSTGADHGPLHYAIAFLKRDKP